MRKLFIDTASSRIVLGLYEDGVMRYEVNEKNDNELSVRIFPMIDTLFQETNVEPKDIDEIDVVNGPGSFTGIRIGLTIAKTYAWALKKNIKVISELQWMASTQFTTDYIVPMIDARRQAVYGGIYDQNLEPIIPDQYILISDLLEKVKSLGKAATFVSYDELPMIEALKTPNPDLLKVIEKNTCGKLLNPHEVKPEYLKKTEAEENLGQEV